MIYSVIGTGAIGGYYGARLAQSGQEVHFLLHRDYDYVIQNGFCVDSCEGNFCLPHPHVYSNTFQMPPSDVVIVALKSTNNHLLSRLLPPLLQPHTIVLLIQNGIGIEEDLQQQFPEVSLAAGLAFICSAKTQPGRVNHQCYGSISIGNYSCPQPELIDQLVEEFTDAGIPTQQVEYATARWRKAVWNMPFNGMTVALNCRTDQLLRHPSTRQLIRQQMMEIVTATRVMNIPNIDEAFVEKMISMTDEMTPYCPSMRLDWDYHRPMELFYLYTRPLALAREAGAPMPRLEMLEAQLRFMEERRQKEKNLS